MLFHAEIDVPALKAAIEKSFEADYPKLDALYKEIHAHPELAFQEVKTAAKLAAEMRALGFDVTEKVGRTGLVAIYKNGDGPTIMVRTELDALPMEEKTGLDYASRDKTNWNGREVFVAHSCGHDIHMASWVGTAKTLLGLKDQWRGTLMFIAQPAEEIGAGAMTGCCSVLQNVPQGRPLVGIRAGCSYRSRRKCDVRHPESFSGKGERSQVGRRCPAQTPWGNHGFPEDSNIFM